MKKPNKIGIRYSTILHVQRLQLGLSLTEYCVADAIYHISANPGSRSPGWFYGNKEYLAELFGVSRQTVHNALNALIGKGIVEREDTYLRTTSIWYDTVVLTKEYGQLEGVLNHVPGGKIVKKFDKMSKNLTKSGGKNVKKFDTDCQNFLQKVSKNLTKNVKKFDFHYNDNIITDNNTITTTEEVEEFFRNISRAWNEKAKELGLEEIKHFPAARKAAVYSLMDSGLWNLEELLKAIQEQPYLLGSNESNWRISFDWILNETNITKVYERYYLRKKRSGRPAEEVISLEDYMNAAAAAFDETKKTIEENPDKFLIIDKYDFSSIMQYAIEKTEKKYRDSQLFLIELNSLITGYLKTLNKKVI